MNCLDYLKSNNHNLRGYSPDTYYYLQESEEECEALFAYLQARYG